jgi:hypothetical protein
MRPDPLLPGLTASYLLGPPHIIMNFPTDQPLIVQRLRRIGSALSNSRTPPCPFLSLPRELLDLIIAPLPLADRLALALTCKSLLIYDGLSLPSLAGKGPKAHREFLIRRFERDLLPTHYTCPKCSRPHKIRSALAASRNCAFESVPDTLPCKVLMRELHYRLLYDSYYRRRAMDRHLESSNPGLPLEHQTKKRLPPIFHWNTKIFTAVFQKDLILAVVFELKHHNIWPLMHSLVIWQPCICHHLIVTPGPGTSDHLFVPIRLGAKELLDLSRDPSHSIDGSCRSCLTDYTIKMERRAPTTFKRAQYSLLIQVWSNLGRDATLDPLGISNKLNTRNFEAHPVGSVRRDYLSVAGGECMRGSK